MPDGRNCAGAERIGNAAVPVNVEAAEGDEEVYRANAARIEHYPRYLQVGNVGSESLPETPTEIASCQVV